MDTENYLERIVGLEMERKSSDREIKELKERVDFLTNSFNGQALTTQSILSKVDNLSESVNNRMDNLDKSFNSVTLFIEEIKAQPKRKLNEFVGYILAALCGSVVPVLIGKLFTK